MKKFSDFILEKTMSEEIVNDVIVVYKYPYDNLYINCPETYQEDDIKEYIDDLMEEYLPSSMKNSKDMLGINAKHLQDAYFEYSSFYRMSYEMDDSTQNLIKYDSSKGKETLTDVKIVTFKLSNLKYKMMFDKFEFNVTEGELIQDTLQNIFKSFEKSSVTNEDYPIKLRFDKVTYHS